MIIASLSLVCFWLSKYITYPLNLESGSIVLLVTCQQVENWLYYLEKKCIRKCFFTIFCHNLPGNSRITVGEENNRVTGKNT